MTTPNVFSNDSIEKLRDDHERLRYQIRNLRELVMRAFSSQTLSQLYVAKVVGTITAASGTTPGVGQARIQYRNTGTGDITQWATDDNSQITVYSFVEAPSGTDVNIFVCQDPFGDFWYVAENCPA